MRYASSAIVVLTCIGCGTLNGARPLDKGQHTAGATFGGPMLTAFGAHIPLPSLVLEGRSGLSPIQGRATDVNYGLNATAAAFGILDIHVGVSHLLLDQQDRRPALSVTERLHLLSNHLDTTKAMDTRALYAMNQLDVTLSGELGKHLIYGGGTKYWNFVNRPSPGYFLGTQLTPNGGRFSVQLEARHLAVGFVPEIQDLDWVSPGTGVLSVTAGVSMTFGGAQ